jgi:hypothetical protein
MERQDLDCLEGLDRDVAAGLAHNRKLEQPSSSCGAGVRPRNGDQIDSCVRDLVAEPVG